MLRIPRWLWALVWCPYHLAQLQASPGEYADHRWLDVELEGKSVTLVVNQKPEDTTQLIDQACTAAAPAWPDCAEAVARGVENELRLRPTFETAWRDDFYGGASLPSDDTEPRVVVTQPASTVLRTDEAVFYWRVEGDFAVGVWNSVSTEAARIKVDGVACMALLAAAGPEEFLASSCIASPSAPTQQGEYLGAEHVHPGNYVLYMQLRDWAARPVGELARIDLNIAAVGQRGNWDDGTLQSRPPHQRPWLTARLNGRSTAAFLHGARPPPLVGGLAVEFTFEPAEALAAVASAQHAAGLGDAQACIHLGSSHQNDVGVLLACVDLDETGVASLSVSAEQLQPVLDDLRLKKRTGLALTAHCETRGHRGLSAAKTTYFAVEGGKAMHVSSGFPELDALQGAVSEFETHIGGSFEKPRKVAALRAAVASKRDPLYCETGFNAGFSALAALTANVNASVVSFDTATLGTINVAFDWIKRTLPQRSLDLRVGSSCDALAQPDVLGGRRCDVVFVDGGHEYEMAACDLLHFASYAAPDAVVIIDDISSNPICLNQPGHCDGPTIAWQQAVRNGFVLEDYCDAEDFCVGRFSVNDKLETSNR